VADNLFINEGPVRGYRGRTRTHLERIGLDVSPDTLVEALPQGERQLVEIAKALHAESKLIIFDEPTTSLSFRESERLFAIIEQLRRDGIGAIYISHALDDVLRLCDGIAVLRDGEVVRDDAARVYSKQELISAMVGRAIEQLYPERASRANADVALEARRLYQAGTLENVSFRLHKGEVLGLGGLMGSGRSETARALFGLDPLKSGAVLINGQPVHRLSVRERISRGMAFVPESRRDDGLFMDAPVNENLEIVHPVPGRVPELAGSLRLACANLDRQPVRQLSGGNQQKVALGKWLIKPPAILILDEPTRGIDVGARRQIYGLMNDLAASGVALLVISSEIEELMGMCDRILIMAKGEIRSESVPPFDRELLLRAAV
jgi:ABC-type sugar transport system ATPase subunit